MTSACTSHTGPDEFISCLSYLHLASGSLDIVPVCTACQRGAQRQHRLARCAGVPVFPPVHLILPLNLSIPTSSSAALPTSGHRTPPENSSSSAHLAAKYLR